MPIALSPKVLCAVLLVLVSGCSIMGQPVKKKVVIQHPTTDVYAHAACHKDLGKAMALAKSLLANDPDNVEVQLIHAYMVERTGRPIQAWELYTSLAEGHYDKSTSLTCNGTLVFGGGVSDVAKFRSLWLAQNLKAQGVNLSRAPMAKAQITPPTIPTAKGMTVLPPPFAKQNSASIPAPVAPVKKKVINTKQTTHGVFVHLASYKGPKALDRGWKEIRRSRIKILGSYGKSIVKVTLKDHKGSILRLGVRAPDKAHARTLCKALKTTRQYCMVMK